MTEVVCSHHLVFVEFYTLNLSGSLLQQYATIGMQIGKNAVDFLVTHVVIVSHMQYKEQFINVAITSTAKHVYLSLKLV